MTFTPIGPDENAWMRRDTVAALIQTITLEVCTGVSGNNKKVFAAAKTYHARVVVEETAIYNASGEVAKSTATVHFYPVATDASVLNSLGQYPDDARITLPDGTTPRILQFESSYDGLGIWLWTVRT